MFLLLPFFVLIAIACDTYLIRAFINPSSLKGWSKRTIIIYCYSLHLLFVTALLLFQKATDIEDDGYMLAIIWIVWFYLLNTLPNITLTLFSIVGYIFGRARRYFIVVGLALGLAIALVMIYGATVGRTKIDVKQVDVTFDSLPSTAEGLKVALFADVHLGNINNLDRRLEELRDAINDQNVDVVIFAGDLINIKVKELSPQAMALLGQIKSRYGTFSVLGNHDLGIYVKDTVRYPSGECVSQLIERQKEMGWSPLINQSVVIADSLTITGLNFPSEYTRKGHSTKMSGVDFSAYNSIPKGAFNITISHTPALWDSIMKQSPANLTLSGHTHAMQMKLTVAGKAYSPASLLYEFWSGLHKKDGRYLYINDGFGFVAYPMRIGTNPEVTILTLHSKKDE